MSHVRFAIIGGGISGLYAAYLLESRGISDYVLFEARDRLGGRVQSVALSGTDAGVANPTDRFDLGPSWFWPDFQPQLDELVTDLGLKQFVQPAQGDSVIERAGAKPVRTPEYLTSQPSIRLLGGIGALVDALASHLNPENVRMGHSIRRLRFLEQRVQIEGESSEGAHGSWTAEHILLAAPPRLLAQDIDFIPALTPSVAHRWRNTPTWMAPHAKYLAVFESAFWNRAGFSGQARSATGPMVEIHDASSPGGHAALFGIPAQARNMMPQGDLQALCRAQLVRLFGQQANQPMAEFLKDWAQDPLTAVAQDWMDGDQHSNNHKVNVDSSLWSGRLIGIGSEWASQFPGYIAGAIEAAALGVRLLLKAD